MIAFEFRWLSVITWHFWWPVTSSKMANEVSRNLAVFRALIKIPGLECCVTPWWNNTRITSVLFTQCFLWKKFSAFSTQRVNNLMPFVRIHNRFPPYLYRLTNQLTKLQHSRYLALVFLHTWWRHQMGTFSALLGLCVGNSTVTGVFPAQRPVTRSFDVFFDLRLNKRLIKQ